MKKRISQILLFSYLLTFAVILTHEHQVKLPGEIVFSSVDDSHSHNYLHTSNVCLVDQLINSYASGISESYIADFSLSVIENLNTELTYKYQNPNGLFKSSRAPPVNI